eukprot:Amastigsp_a676905_368.p3 type:complete len:183 gc:universal Amastigsp_a676905_368:1882-1334(-)
MVAAQLHYVSLLHDCAHHRRQQHAPVVLRQPVRICAAQQILSASERNSWCGLAAAARHRGRDDVGVHSRLLCSQHCRGQVHERRRESLGQRGGYDSDEPPAHRRDTNSTAARARRHLPPAAQVHRQRRLLRRPVHQDRSVEGRVRARRPLPVLAACRRAVVLHPAALLPRRRLHPASQHDKP